MWLYAPAATSPCPQVWSAGGMLGSVWGSWVSDGPVQALAPACLCLGLEWPPSTSGACYSWQITPPWLTLLPCPPHAPSPRLAWSLISPTRQPLAMGRDRTEEKEEGERGEQAGQEEAKSSWRLLSRGPLCSGLCTGTSPPSTGFPHLEHECSFCGRSTVTLEALTKII